MFLVGLFTLKILWILIRIRVHKNARGYGSSKTERVERSASEQFNVGSWQLKQLALIVSRSVKQAEGVFSPLNPHCEYLSSVVLRIHKWKSEDPDPNFGKKSVKKKVKLIRLCLALFIVAESGFDTFLYLRIRIRGPKGSNRIQNRNTVHLDPDPCLGSSTDCDNYDFKKKARIIIIVGSESL